MKYEFAAKTTNQDVVLSRFIFFVLKENKPLWTPLANGEPCADL